jgi:hypothetical protein
MTDLYIGKPIMRPYCTLTGGHFWSDRDECVVCGQSWNALYEIVHEPQPDGTVKSSVVSR